MSPGSSPWVMAALAVLVSVVFALFARLPLPFEGFAALTAAGLAGLLTVSFGLFLPVRWLWTDAERLQHAFRARHDISDARAASALEAISTAHHRATAMRRASARFADPLRDKAETAADLLDGAAREIFYDPGLLGSVRANLIRSELVEDAVRAHAKMRGRADQDVIDGQVTRSRASVETALDALISAFEAAEGRIANRLLHEVDAASSTAETLLAPRRKPALSRTPHEELK